MPGVFVRSTASALSRLRGLLIFGTHLSTHTYDRDFPTLLETLLDK